MSVLLPSRVLSPQSSYARFIGRAGAASILTLLAVAAGLALPAAAQERSQQRFQREWLEPYLTRGIPGQARRLIEAGAASKAVPLLERYLRPKSARFALQARFLLGRALLASEEWERAASIFVALVEPYEALRDYCRFYGAQALYHAKRFAEAERLASELSTQAVLKQEAEILRADALRALDRYSESATIWDGYLRRHPGGGQVATAHFRIAEARERQAAKAGPAAARLLDEALEHYRQVMIRAPFGPHRAAAERRATALAQGRGKQGLALTPPERFEQALAYFRGMRNQDAEATLRTLLQDKKLDVSLRCRASFYLGKSVFNQRQRARSVAAYEEAVASCAKSGERELVVKSLFDQGKALCNAKDFEGAIARFARIEKEFPAHSFADDARLWIAEAQDSLKRKTDVVATLTELPRRYPNGDMTHEALWRLARMAYLDRKYSEALGYLERSLSELGRPRYYYSAGQALYWKARILDRLSRPGEAARAYEECIRQYPLSYYALLAFNRLRESHAPVARRLERELLGSVGRDAGQWSFAPRPLFAAAGFRRSVELARLGLGGEAARELERVAPRKSSAGASGEEDTWLLAVLYDRAGLWSHSVQLAKSLDGSFRRGYPSGEQYRLWSLAYPQAFLPLVRESARHADVTTELVTSIMREESGFSTVIESYANALGLMQLILPTARTAGRQHRLAVTRELLHDPAVNIKLGASYLGFLQQTFQRITPLAVAGYNAGEGAVFRWLQQMGSVPLDELVERIPYDQTRRYTKRVMSSIFTYSVLYRRGDSRLPRIPQRVPRVTPRPFRGE